LTDSFHDPWIEIARYALRAEAEAAVLVLAAAGIGCHLVEEGTGFGLFVSAHDVPLARRELVEYARENKARPTPVLRPAAEGLGGALIYAAVLSAINGAANRRLWGFDWLSAGAADAGLILSGEWWRAITALSLHADFGHLASNIVAGAILAILSSQILGSGLTWLTILLASGLGNLLNALMQPAPHIGIGASTAVFAALGVLAALRWRTEARWTPGWRRWLPLAAGVALLAVLGTGGERTDVGAHATGFVMGVALGAGLHLLGERVPKGPTAQAAHGGAAGALFCLAWLLALTA
jgi:membrane associated rhomboid family serine protease